MLLKIKCALLKVDSFFFKGNIKAFHTRYFKYRRKAYRLTKDIYFPPHRFANRNVRLGPAAELLAIGGDLSPQRMIYALQNGIYPMFFENEPILWWTSEIRCVIFPQNIHIPKDAWSLIKKNNFKLTVDEAFYEVVKACSESRKYYTWITPQREESTLKLYELGFAHSIEVWQNEVLVGGLFGIAYGSYFYGESSFTRIKHASKLAMIALSLRLNEMNYCIYDCGIWPTDHLKSMGATIIPRDEFLKILGLSVETPSKCKEWGSLFKNWDFKQAAEKHQADRQRELKSK